MLKECLEVFKSDLENNRQQIIDSYVPTDGTYVIVSPKDDSFEIKDCFDIKYDKKEKKLLGKTNINFYDVCNYDYNSKLIDMNKPIDGKKIIHSNNYLSFFIKKESLENGKLNDEIIDNYYNILKNPMEKYAKNKKAVVLYKSIEEEIGEVDGELLEKIKVWIKGNIFNLDMEIKGKDYLKIFFEYPIEKYTNEAKRYLIPNIYNNNDCNIDLDGDIYGLPNNNMGLNAKKPYLENKTRKNTSPYLINAEEVQLQKEFFDYLMNEVSLGKVNAFIDVDNKIIDVKENGKLPNNNFNGLFLRLKKGKEVEIHDFDTITSYKSILKKELNVKNIIELDLDSKSNQKYLECYKSFKKKEAVQRILDEVFFSGYLINNYFTDAGDISIKDNVLKNNLLTARNSIFNWIYKGIQKGSANGIASVLEKVSLNLIKGSINNGYIPKAGHQFNLRWSLKEYFEGGRGMADIIHDLKAALRVKINEKDTSKIEDDKQYYFAVGQLISYLLSKSKGKKKPHSLANQFINSKNNEDLKEKLRKLYVKYSYDPDINSKRFNNLYAMIVGYLPEGKVDTDLVIAGYLNSSLIYEKSEGDK
ncbi:type I-B CRISPR-associated protein Cas8b/Csh1 [Clostridium butyricum]|uniref:type I-B CRISPR-associated protein Cas8b/Csh1 n=1 Tax=Clostridium butyricum TaxID=1492 RepID=UPI002102265C|nr:type I-B CRISPR-associated protein Cas8b/Csh1 [Clostridium butyricum]MCQ2015240.1 type I-B CRISPR-associated protein Cas8b/Csh1 [Clostridium butyricum]MCQ2026679.1 type I-B CRISPR-associated protein Cas8b/Csh1 [Clostridium butyricum]